MKIERAAHHTQYDRQQRKQTRCNRDPKTGFGSHPANVVFLLRTHSVSYSKVHIILAIRSDWVYNNTDVLI